MNTLMKIGNRMSNNFLTNLPSCNIEDIGSIYKSLIMTQEDKFNEYMCTLVSKYRSKQYKEVIRSIRESKNNFDKLPTQYNLTILKIICMIKVIKHKIKKYNKILLSNSDKKKIKNKPALFAKRRKSTDISQHSKQSVTSSIANWQSLLYNEINNLLEKYFYNEEKIELENPYKCNLIEKIVNIFLRLIELNVFYQEKLGLTIESFTYLCIADRLIKKYIKFMNSAKNINYCRKIYLNISKYLLENFNNDLVECYIKDIISLCKREILIKSMDVSYLIDLKKSKSFSTVFLDWTVALIYYGIINEYKCKFFDAIDSYKQAIFITQKLVSRQYHIIENFSQLCLQRNLEYISTILFLSEQIEILNQRKIMAELEYNERKSRNKYYAFNISREKKLTQIENDVENLKIPQIEGIDKNVCHIGRSKYFTDRKYNNEYMPYSDYLLTNKRLLDAFQSKDFKFIINKMKQINMVDLDHVTKEKIQGLISKINHRKEYKYLRQKFKNENNKNNKDDNLVNSNSNRSIHILSKNNSSQIIKNKKNYIELSKCNQPVKNISLLSSTKSYTNFNKSETINKSNYNNCSSDRKNFMGNCYLTSRETTRVNSNINRYKQFTPLNSASYRYYCNNYKSPQKKNNNIIPISTEKSSNTINSKNMKNNIHIRKNNSTEFSVPYYKKSKYYFQYCPSFMKKLKFLDYLDNKENKFHKNILHIRKFEEIPSFNADVVEGEIREEAVKKHKLIKSIVDSQFKLNENNKLMEQLESRKKSYNFGNNKYSNFPMNYKINITKIKQESNNGKSSESTDEKNDENSFINFEESNIKENHKKIINKIEHDIHTLDEEHNKKKQLIDSLSRYKNKNNIKGNMKVKKFI